MSLVVLMYIHWAACEATQFIKWVSSGFLFSFFLSEEEGWGCYFGKSWWGALSASWNFWLGQISPTIFWEAGIGGGVHENNAYCFLLRMAHLLIFIHNGGIWKGSIQPQRKNGTHFSCYETLPKGYNVQMSKCFQNSHTRCYVTQWSAISLVAWVCAPTLSPRKIGSPVKIAFWRFLCNIYNYTISLL